MALRPIPCPFLPLLLLASALRLPADPVSVPPAPPVVHVTDGQDRLAADQLPLAAEAKAKADALYSEAVVSLDAPDHDPAKIQEMLRQVVALDPDFDDARVKLADVLLQSGQIEAAFAQLEKAAADRPRSPAIEAMLGYAERLRGHNEEAARWSVQALERDPTQSVSMRVLLEIAGERNDLDGAVLRIEDTLREGAPAPASAWLALGRLYLEMARNASPSISSEAMLRLLLPIYREAAAQPPPDVERFGLLAQTYQDLGRKREALDTLHRALELAPSDLDILLRCAQLEMDLEEKDLALRDYQHAYDLNPNLAGLRDMLGRLYLDNNRYADAEQIFQDALADQPNDPDIEADLGVAFEGGRNHAQAQTWFQRAFSSPACPPEAYLKLAVFQLSNRQVREAGETLDLAEKRFPDSARILFYRAIQDRYAKNYPAALACLREMRQVAAPTESDLFGPNYYLESALTMSLAGQDAAIEPLLREGLGKYPENPDLMNELAYSWADHDANLDQALALGRRAAQLDPDDGAIQDTCGWIYFKLGRAEDALPYLQRAAVMTDNDPVVLEHVGDALLKLGHRRQALEAWRHALKKDPSDHNLLIRITAAEAPANHAFPRSAPTP